MFTPGHLVVIRAAAQEPSVQRIFVNAAIKKALCREAKGDRFWLHKVRPMYGHDYHFHIRIRCPPGSECEGQTDPAESEGCKPADLGLPLVKRLHDRLDIAKLLQLLLDGLALALASLLGG